MVVDDFVVVVELSVIVVVLADVVVNVSVVEVVDVLVVVVVVVVPVPVVLVSVAVVLEAVVENTITLMVPLMKLACGTQKYSNVPSVSAIHLNEYSLGPMALGPTTTSFSLYPGASSALTAKLCPASTKPTNLIILPKVTVMVG